MRPPLSEITQHIRQAWNRGVDAALNGGGKSSCYAWSYRVARRYFPSIDPQEVTRIAKGQATLCEDANNQAVVVVTSAHLESALNKEEP